MTTKAADVRNWAREKGLPVGTRGHLPPEVIDQFNSRRKPENQFADTNPSSKAAVRAERA